MIGKSAPAFALLDQNKQLVTNEDLMGSKALVVFMPFPFTGFCDGEVCEIRDNFASLASADAKVVIITAHAIPTNAKWASENNVEFPVLSDFWPHGETSQAYGVFNDTLGVAIRATFVLDEEGVVRSVVATEKLNIPREFTNYTDALAAI
jgi:peroxiredoxin